MGNQPALLDITWFGPGNEERRSLSYPLEQGPEEEQDSNAQDKSKKQKDTSISLGEQLLRDKVITGEQLEQSLAHQSRTGESLIRILVRRRCVRLSQLGPYVKIGDLRKFAVLDLENDYYQGTLHIMLIHRRSGFSLGFAR